MLIDNLSLAYHLQEVRQFIEGAYINNVSELPNGSVKIKLHSKSGSKDLIISPGAFFISEYSLAARHGKTNFAVSLKKELYNRKIVSISMREFDRVVEIKLLEHSLILEFLGEGNAVLLSKEETILSSRKNEEWSDRKIKKGEKYIFPKSRQNPLQLSVNFLFASFSSSEKDAIRSLIACANISPVIAEETFFLLKIPKGAKASSLNESELGRICEKIKDFYSLSVPASSCAYKDFVYPFALAHLSEKPLQVSSLNSYLNTKLALGASQKKLQENLKGGQIKKDRKSGFEIMRKQQDAARVKFSDAQAIARRKAEIIYENYGAIEELINAMQKAAKSGLSEKEIMAKFATAAKNGSKAAAIVKKINLAEKKFEIEV